MDSLKGEGITRAVLYPGGHCLTKDTYHLERGVKISEGTLDYPAGLDSIFVLARKVNDFLPVHMYNLTEGGSFAGWQETFGFQGCHTWLGVYLYGDWARG